MIEVSDARKAALWRHLRVRLDRLRGRRSDRRRVLLLGDSAMLVRYLDRFSRLFADDPRLEFQVSTAGRRAVAEMVAAAAAARRLPYIPCRRARARWWDLVVFANHTDTGQVPPLSPRLRIQHGFGTGKRYGGENHRYGPSMVLDRAGRPVYDRIFESSDLARRQAEANVPALAGTIAVVGDLDADELLRHRHDRERCRQQLGIRDGERVALLWSSFGKHCLLSTFGDRLFAEAAEISRRSPWRFVLSVHPHYWVVGGDEFERRMRELTAQGIIVRPSGAPFVEPFVAADLMIADHTSLGGMYALLGKPLCFVPVGDDALDPASVLAELHRLCPRLSDPARLCEILELEYPCDRIAAVAGQSHSRPGAGAELMRAEVYSLLGLPPSLGGEVRP